MNRSGAPIGPLAVLPDGDPALEQAVRRGGGRLEPLSERTRGVIWRHGYGPDQLAAVLDQHPAIGWVQLPAAGVESFAELFAGRHRALLWTCGKGAYAEPVAEHALALTLAVMRRLPRHARASSWAHEARSTSLFDAGVVIVGGGGIARSLLELLRPFRVRVTMVRRRPEPVPGADRTVTSDRLDEVLPAADVVVIAAASTQHTAQLFDAERLARLRSHAVLINVARGGLIDSVALLAALQAGAIAGAGLDVTDPEPLPDGHPLWFEPRCLITAHSADPEVMMAPRYAARVLENVHAFARGAELVGVIDPNLGY